MKYLESHESERQLLGMCLLDFTNLLGGLNMIGQVGLDGFNCIGQVGWGASYFLD